MSCQSIKKEAMSWSQTSNQTSKQHWPRVKCGLQICRLYYESKFRCWCGQKPSANWKRCPGRPCGQWMDQLCKDNHSPADFNQSISQIRICNVARTTGELKFQTNAEKMHKNLRGYLLWGAAVAASRDSSHCDYLLFFSVCQLFCRWVYVLSYAASDSVPGWLLFLNNHSVFAKFLVMDYRHFTCSGRGTVPSHTKSTKAKSICG